MKKLLLFILWTGFAASANISFFDIKDMDHSLKVSFIHFMHSLFKPDFFVETGTYYGQTALKASSVFDRVYTIELSPELYQLFINQYGHVRHITPIYGASEDVLPVLCPTLSGRGIFWLDAHYSGGETAQGSQNTPLLDELKAIFNEPAIKPIILIDDIRCFFESNFNPEHSTVLDGYPRLTHIRKLVNEQLEEYEFFILGDIAAIYPKSDMVEASSLAKIWTETYFALESGRSFRQVEAPLFKALRNASQQEIQAAQKLSNKFNKSPMLLFLNALLDLKNEDVKSYLLKLQQAVALGLPH